jgi:hypothetical protein
VWAPVSLGIVRYVSAILILNRKTIIVKFQGVFQNTEKEKSFNAQGIF